MTDTPAVYCFTATAGQVPGDSRWLTAGERQKLERLHFTKRRADWRLGRWTAKRAVCLWWARRGAAPGESEVDIAAAGDGGPELWVRGEKSPVTLSISHCRGVGFSVLSPDGLGVGCDVEAIEGRSERFVSDYFTEGECALANRAAGEERGLIVNLIWSAKESALKAVRRGLERDTRSVEVLLPRDTLRSTVAWAPISVRDSESARQLAGWWKAEGKLLYTVLASREIDPPLSLA